MDKSIEWPWDWEEEVRWKAELEEKDDDFLETLIESAFEGGITAGPYGLEPRQEEEATENGAAEKYLVAA